LLDHFFGVVGWDVDGDDLFWIELFFDERAAFGGDEEPVWDERDVDLFLREVKGGEVSGVMSASPMWRSFFPPISMTWPRF